MLVSKLNFNLWQIFIDGPYGAPARYAHLLSLIEFYIEFMYRMKKTRILESIIEFEIAINFESTFEFSVNFESIFECSLKFEFG